MNIDKRWLIVLSVAASAGAGVLAALASGRKHHRHIAHRQHRESVKSWENEGGNLAPPMAPSVQAAMAAKP